MSHMIRGQEQVRTANVNLREHLPPSDVPASRLRWLNDAGVRPDGDYVLYWMTAYRRTRSNYALQRAADWSRHLAVPLVVLSALRLDYQYASARLHAFLLDSMQDVEQQLTGTNAEVFSYVEPDHGAGRGLLTALAADSCLVVADDAPVFFLPAMVSAAADRVDVAMEGVDHNSLMPLASSERAFLRAYDLRRYHQRELAAYLEEFPGQSMGDVPISPAGLLDHIRRDWPSARPERSLIPTLPLDHKVGVLPQRGGETEGRRILERFVAKRLSRYGERNHPDEDVASGLSPYLHFGNVSVHDVFGAVALAEGWNPGRLASGGSGSRSGWWGLSEAAEGFLDQVVTWRELGYRSARVIPDNGSYAALPGWAQATLDEHSGDAREFLYTREQLEDAETHDHLWNAAQRQLRDEGTIHNYLRMLWGKKILEWTRHPEEAHDIMFELNDRYALDGRDPNSVSGIHWVLGRYDRPWGPERPIFGKVRYMSSESTLRKLRLRSYLGQSKMLNT